jgi:hemin uptake protein HemP
MIADSHDAALDAANAATDVAAGNRSISFRSNRIDSRELFTSGREITIAHGDETYRLRLTSQNKLILTK